MKKMIFIFSAVLVISCFGLEDKKNNKPLIRDETTGLWKVEEENFGPITKEQLIGLWQVQDSVVSASYDDIYQFFSNDSFSFHFHAWGEYNRISCINGKYYIKNDSLYTLVLNRGELIGGIVSRGDPSWQSEWIIDSADYKIFNQPYSKWETVNIDIKYEENEKPVVIEIGSNLYYKIYDDPLR